MAPFGSVGYTLLEACLLVGFRSKSCAKNTFSSIYIYTNALVRVLIAWRRLGYLLFSLIIFMVLVLLRQPLDIVEHIVFFVLWLGYSGRTRSWKDEWTNDDA